MVTNNQINTGKPIGVVDGGTGGASFTAYSLIAAGTTSTGALQSAGTGTSGQWYVSNGSASLGTFKSLKVQNQIFTSNGTYTPTSGMIYCQIQCLGGGGAGGGGPTTSSTQCASGGGGAGGEYAVGVFTASTIGASKAITIGAGGVGSANTNGGSGGTTSVGVLMTALGGSGGTAGTATTLCIATNGGAGGTGGTGGDYRTPGAPGVLGIVALISTGFISVGGIGGSSQLGAGGIPQVGAGGSGSGYGAGGAGCSNIPTTVASTAGGNGSAGVVIVTEYIIA